MNLKNLEKIQSSWYFLLVVIIIYITIYSKNPELFSSAMNLFVNILTNILPIFVVVFILMSLTNYFITKEVVSKYLKQRGVKKWFFVIVTGILSSGPIYMWYPLLADLKNKGLGYGFIACFLYNRAIKIPLLPVAILYFGWKYILVLSLVMIFMSVIQGVIINKLME